MSALTRAGPAPFAGHDEGPRGLRRPHQRPPSRPRVPTTSGPVPPLASAQFPARPPADETPIPAAKGRLTSDPATHPLSSAQFPDPRGRRPLVARGDETPTPAAKGRLTSDPATHPLSSAQFPDPRGRRPLVACGDETPPPAARGRLTSDPAPHPLSSAQFPDPAAEGHSSPWATKPRPPRPKAAYRTRSRMSSSDCAHSRHTT